MPICADTDNVWFEDSEGNQGARHLYRRKSVRSHLPAETPYGALIPSGLSTTALAFDTPRLRPWPPARRSRGNTADVTQLIRPEDISVAISPEWMAPPGPSFRPPFGTVTGQRREVFDAVSILALVLEDWVSQQGAWQTVSPGVRYRAPAFHASIGAEPPSELVQISTVHPAVTSGAVVRYTRPVWWQARSAEFPLTTVITDDQQVIGAWRFQPIVRWTPPRLAPSGWAETPLAFTLDVGKYESALESVPAPRWPLPKLGPATSPDATAAYQGTLDTNAVTVGVRVPALEAFPAAHWKPPAWVSAQSASVSLGDRDSMDPGAAAWASGIAVRFASGYTASCGAKPAAVPPWQSFVTIAGPLWCDGAWVYVAGAEVGGVLAG